MNPIYDVDNCFQRLRKWWVHLAHRTSNPSYVREMSWHLSELQDLLRRATEIHVPDMLPERERTFDEFEERRELLDRLESNLPDFVDLLFSRKGPAAGHKVCFNRIEKTASCIPSTLMICLPSL